jgi:hypothetical protein
VRGEQLSGDHSFELIFRSDANKRCHGRVALLILCLLVGMLDPKSSSGLMRTLFQWSDREPPMRFRVAADAAIRYLVDKVHGLGGLIIVDRNGTCARAHSPPGMLTGTAENGEVRIQTT